MNYTEILQQYYIAYYGRAADQDGLDQWLAQIDAAETEAEKLQVLDNVRASFGSPEQAEFVAIYGEDTTDGDFIDKAYVNILNRDFDEGGRDFWLETIGTYKQKHLDAGETEADATLKARADVLSLIIDAALEPGEGADFETVSKSTELAMYITEQTEGLTAEQTTEFLNATKEQLASETLGETSIEDLKAQADETKQEIVNEGETFTLTEDDAGGDFEGTDFDDTFIAESGSLEGTFVDGRGGDDVMNVTYKAADIAGDYTPVIRNIETINIDIDAFDGTNATFNATSVRGATITLSSEKLGYNGEAGVSNAGGNNVTAGAKVTDLTVAGITTGAVDAGSATTVNVDSETATENTLGLTVNGDLTAAIGATNTFEAVNLTTTADAEVELDTSDFTDNVLTVSGEGDVTLLSADELDGEEIVNSLTSGELVADVDATDIDGTDWDVTRVNISADIAAFTAPDAGTVDLEETQAGLTITGQSATTGTVTVNTAVDQTSLTFATLKTATLNVTDEATIGTLVTGGADTTVDVAADTTISTLNAAGDDVAITGEGDVTIGGAAADADKVDASGLTGKLDLTQDADKSLEALGGSGDNEVTFAGTTNDSIYTGGTGDDTVTFVTTTGNATANLAAGGDNTVTANAITTGTLAVTGGAGADEITLTVAGADATVALELGAGNDIVDITGGIQNDTTFAVDFGSGTDTLKIDTDLTGATLNLSGLTNLNIAGGDIAQLTGAQITGQSWTIEGEGAGTSFNVDAVAAGGTIDLSNLSFDNTIDKGVESTVITGGAGVDNVILSSVADEFTSAAADVGATATTADVLTGFTTGTDSIAITGATDGVAFTQADGSVYADFDAFLAAANANATVGSTDTEFFFAYDVAGSGDGWLAFDGNDDGDIDSVIKLVGLSEADSLVAGDLTAAA